MLAAGASHAAIMHISLSEISPSATSARSGPVFEGGLETRVTISWGSDSRIRFARASRDRPKIRRCVRGIALRLRSPETEGIVTVPANVAAQASTIGGLYLHLAHTFVRSGVGAGSWRFDVRSPGAKAKTRRGNGKPKQAAVGPRRWERQRAETRGRPRPSRMLRARIRKRSQWARGGRQVQRLASATVASRFSDQITRPSPCEIRKT